MAKNSPAKIAANRRYQAKAYDLITTRAKKELDLPRRIEAAAAATGKKKSKYLIDAITAQLEQDEQAQAAEGK